jgi:tetratricopeptide (TPR) repeat protein
VARARLESLLDRVGEHSTQVTELMHLLAWAYLDEGDMQRARATLAAGQARARDDGYQVVIAEFLRIQGQVCSREGRWAEAEAALEANLALCRDMSYLHEQVKALFVYGQVYATQRKLERAHETYEAALAICHRLGERLYASHIERALGELEARDEAV